MYEDGWEGQAPNMDDTFCFTLYRKELSFPISSRLEELNQVRSLALTGKGAPAVVSLSAAVFH